ncbi:MAG TPA: DUF3311 domain-containing protein [Alloacidobacterium sp.]|nr:DUF3311 domain-containing protein [Alloacidobacterium sp.]
MAASTRKSRRAHWNWLLVLPALALMLPGTYSRATPELFGFPFFYWYQMAWIAMTSLITGVVYIATRERS